MANSILKFESFANGNAINLANKNNSTATKLQNRIARPVGSSQRKYSISRVRMKYNRPIEKNKMAPRMRAFV